MVWGEVATLKDFPGGASGEEPACLRDTGWEDPLEEGMATHSKIFAWRIHGILADFGPWGHTESTEAT